MNFLPEFWQRLTQAHSSIQCPDQRRQAQLLSSLLLSLIGLSILGIIPSILRGQLSTEIYVVAASIGLHMVIYLLSRSPYFQAAIYLMISLIIITLYTSIALEPEVVEGYVIYLIVGVLLTGVLLSVRATILVALISTVPIIGLWFLGDHSKFLYPALFLTLCSTLIIIFKHHRNLLEADRQSQLRQREQQYRTLAETHATTSGQLQNIFHNLDNVFFSIDIVAGKTLQVSPACEKIYGRPPRDFFEDPFLFQNCVHPDDADMVKETARLMFTGQPSLSEIRILQPSGEIRWVLAHLKPTLDDKTGGFLRVDGIITDITERIQARELLIQARDEALRLAKMKSEFMSTISHEIRTPMTGIMGMLELLIETSLDCEQLDFVTDAHQSSKKLLQIVNTVLDFSRIDAGQVVLENDPMSIVKIVADLQSDFEQQASAKKLDFSLEVDPQVPARVLGDATRLHQILSNIVSNAIKFTPTGWVKLQIQLVQQVAATPEAVLLHFEISDSGVGIGEEQLKHIFENFARADGSTRRRHGGTGLGLAISHRLVQLMGGQLAVESELGKGTTFHFTLNLSLAVASTPPVAATIMQTA